MSDTQKDLYKKLLGGYGESLAVKKLKKSGYRVIKRNYITPFGEADVVCRKKDAVVFVEVKTRTSDSFGTPAEAVGREKRRKYRDIASYYILRHGECNVEFAVAEVTPDGVNIIENAF